MLLSEFYSYAGLLSFGLTWFAILYVLYKNPREFSKSISHHAAKDSKVYRLFAIIMSSALFFLVIYLFLFLVPTLDLHIFVVILFLIAILIELLTTWIPLTDDRKFHPHTILSNTAAFLMPVITLGYAIFTRLNSALLSIAYTGLVVMIGLLIIFFTIPKARKIYLIYQSIYVAAFQLTVVLTPLFL